MIKKLIKDIIKGERGFNKGEGISPESEGIPQKARVSPIPLLPRRRGMEDTTDLLNSLLFLYKRPVIINSFDKYARTRKSERNPPHSRQCLSNRT